MGVIPLAGSNSKVSMSPVIFVLPLSAPKLQPCCAKQLTLEKKVEQAFALPIHIDSVSSSNFISPASIVIFWKSSMNVKSLNSSTKIFPGMKQVEESIYKPRVFGAMKSLK